MKSKLLILLSAALLGIAPVAAAKTFKNRRWGYQLRVPDGWIDAAMSAKEEWIASKHLGKRELAAKNSEFYVAERPEIWVVGFPRGRERGAKSEKRGKVTTITVRNPYQDYKDFLKREKWFVGGGFHFSKEKETEVGGVKVTQYEIKVEKMVESPIRIVTWVYHFPEIDYAIQCRVLEDYYKKFKGPYTATLRSFKRIKRTQAMPGTATTTGKKIVDVVDEKKLTPAERKKRREEAFRRTLRKEVEALPKGWYILDSKRYVALTNADRKFTKRSLDHAEAVRTYLERVFGAIGGDYVPPGILRVFATRAEERAFQQTTGNLWFDAVEQVLVTQTVGTDRSWEFEYLSGRLTSQFLSFKNRLLSDNMPYWFREGIKQHMRFARSKGKRVEIKPDPYDRQRIKDVIKQGKTIPIKEMFEKGEPRNMTLSQVGSVVSYLMTKGNRGKTKDAIRNYLGNLVGAIQAAQAEYTAFEKKREEEAVEEAAGARTAGGESEEESEEESGEESGEGEKRWEAIREAMKKKRETILKKAFEATFGHLRDGDWKRLDRAWLAYAG